MRQSRKLEHLQYSLKLPDGPGTNGFSDITPIHNCLPELSVDDVKLSTSLLGLSLPHPIVINAITGGSADVMPVNAALAEFARRTNCVMAVGSQYAALEFPEVQESYKVINRVNPEGIVFANIGAHATVKQARQVVDMINAKALQIHLNVAQEITMTEGDRNFKGYLDNIASIVNAVGVPVIVKEVGCGISREQALMLVNVGVRAIDTGGKGGTNFIAIEAARNKTTLLEERLNWGIPTAISALEVKSVLPNSVELIVSGGIRTPLEVIKSLILGAKGVGLALPIIKVVYENGVDYAVEWFSAFLKQLKDYMILVGAADIEHLSTIPVVITGYCREWLTARQIDIFQYANRKRCGS